MLPIYHPLTRVSYSQDFAKFSILSRPNSHKSLGNCQIHLLPPPPLSPSLSLPADPSSISLGADGSKLSSFSSSTSFCSVFKCWSEELGSYNTRCPQFQSKLGALPKASWPSSSITTPFKSSLTPKISITTSGDLIKCQAGLSLTHSKITASWLASFIPIVGRGCGGSVMVTVTEGILTRKQSRQLHRI